VPNPLLPSGGLGDRFALAAPASGGSGGGAGAGAGDVVAAGPKHSPMPSLRSSDRSHRVETPIPAVISTTVMPAQMGTYVTVGSTTSNPARAAASSRKIPAQSKVTCWKKRCRRGCRKFRQRSPITSAASRSAMGLCPRAVQAKTMHRPRFASGKCTRKIHKFPVATATRPCRVSTMREIATSPGTVPVKSLRPMAVTQIAASMAITPA